MKNIKRPPLSLFLFPIVIFITIFPFSLLLQTVELFLFLLWFLSSENVWNDLIILSILLLCLHKTWCSLFFKGKWTVFLSAYSMILSINWVQASSVLYSQYMWQPMNLTLLFLSVRSNQIYYGMHSSEEIIKGRLNMVQWTYCVFMDTTWLKSQSNQKPYQIIIFQIFHHWVANGLPFPSLSD